MNLVLFGPEHFATLRPEPTPDDDVAMLRAVLDAPTPASRRAPEIPVVPAAEIAAHVPPDPLEAQGYRVTPGRRRARSAAPTPGNGTHDPRRRHQPRCDTDPASRTREACRCVCARELLDRGGGVARRRLVAHATSLRRPAGRDADRRGDRADPGSARSVHASRSICSTSGRAGSGASRRANWPWRPGGAATPSDNGSCIRPTPSVGPLTTPRITCPSPPQPASTRRGTCSSTRRRRSSSSPSTTPTTTSCSASRR